MNLATNKSFLALLIATTFLTGCQLEQNSASDSQASSQLKEPKTKTTLPSKKIVEEPAVVEPIVAEPVVEEPVVEEPIATEPIVTEPVIAEPVATEPAVATCVEGNASIEGLVADKGTKAGLPNVKVSIGGCITTTDADGFYKLENIAAADQTVVTFAAEDYYRNSALVQIDQYLEGTTTLSPNYLEFSLDKYTDVNTTDSQNAIIWKVEDGFGLSIPGGIYTDAAGDPYSGTVTARRTYREQAESSRDVAFPGSYSGENSSGVIVPFVSYGFVVIDLADESGAPLGVSDKITLTFPATGATEEIIPLWYYDYELGLWIEEGYAQLQADNSYKGDVSHTGSWSLSSPIADAVGVYRGRIVDIDKLPQGDVRISAVSENWVATDYSTDADGYFEIKVVPNSPFTLKAYHCNDKYEALYDGTIAAVASGDLVEETL